MNIYLKIPSNDDNLGIRWPTEENLVGFRFQLEEYHMSRNTNELWCNDTVWQSITMCMCYMVLIEIDLKKI